MKRPEPMLWLSDARGIYIPRDFANSFVDRSKHVQNVTEEDWAILEDPDHEWYWEAWDEVLQNAVVTDNEGTRFRLSQNGDLWLIPEGMEWSEEQDFYVWPDEEYASE
jgi:hypothetical protein